MINITVRLKEVPKYTLIELEDILAQAKLNNQDITMNSNPDFGFACIDVETTECVKIRAIADVVEMLDYASIGEFVTGMEIEL